MVLKQDGKKQLIKFIEKPQETNWREGENLRIELNQQSASEWEDIKMGELMNTEHK